MRGTWSVHEKLLPRFWLKMNADSVRNRGVEHPLLSGQLETFASEYQRWQADLVAFSTDTKLQCGLSLIKPARGLEDPAWDSLPTKTAITI